MLTSHFNINSFEICLALGQCRLYELSTLLCLIGPIVTYVPTRGLHYQIYKCTFVSNKIEHYF
jgi:hypothetical protein